MSNHVEIENFITPELVEYAYSRAMRAQESGRQVFADTGFRAALARDPKLLKVLETASNILDKMTDAQHGRTMRAPDASLGEKQGTTELQLWREAYKMCDQNTPLRAFEWVYGAAALIAGYNS